ncbi:MAG: cobyric acid synthase [Deltaproteobacteria bacterium]|nr:cobyric acid synthase [Deltaproteobacteria bacterium]
MNRTTKTIMFLGTGSDVGKSIVATAFCRIFRRRGFSVAPFKAQNMSNNSYVTIEGGEIGRAQVVQAEAAGLPPSSDMNPVLLKPSSNLGSQVVVQGRVRGQMSAAEYHRRKKELQDAVMESFHRLADQHEIIVMEGAGSCCEINLRDQDLANFGMAEKVDAPCVLVADIDRGGVFAQIIGSMVLMSPREKELTAGFIINKFRGDPDLFTSGIEFIEQQTNKPVYGVAPYYTDVFIDPEDSVAVQPDKRPLRPLRSDGLNVAVIRLPGISNFTDLEALEREPDITLNYLGRSQPLDQYDLVILPGTKNTVEDAVWLVRSGWAKAIKNHTAAGGWLCGLCGGYQLLGQHILDPLAVESPRGKVRGLGLMPLTTTLEANKVLRRVVGQDLLLKEPVTGYEIHMGRTEPSGSNHDSIQPSPLLRLHEPGRRTSWLDGWAIEGGRILGTYVHGLFDSPTWRRTYLNHLRQTKGLPERRSATPVRRSRFHQYDRLADHFEQHIDVDSILKIVGV